MRRKPLIVALFVLIASGFGGYNFLASSRLKASGNGAINREDMTAETVVKEIDNGLALQIIDKNQEPVMEISFQQNCQQARVEIGANSLPSEAFVRIVDTTGKLLVGEYTRIYDGAAEGGISYYFPETPKDYTVSLDVGTLVEIKAQKVKFLSTLDGAEVAEYAPRTETENYLVTASGLKRMDWDEAKTREIMYRQLKRYADQEIRKYQAEIPEHVLYNKRLDAEKKAEIRQLYAKLLATDRGEYTEFVERLRKGGSPVIIYRGAAEYKREEWVKLTKLFDINDNEDGKIASEKIVIEGEVDFAKAGKYNLVVSAVDSDGNVAQMPLTISVSEELAEKPSQMPSIDPPTDTPSGDNAGTEKPDEPSEEPTPEPETPAEPITPSQPNGPTEPEIKDETMFAPETNEDAGSAGAWSAPETKVDYTAENDTMNAELIENPSTALLATNNAAAEKPATSETPIQVKEPETKTEADKKPAAKTEEKKSENDAGATGRTIMAVVAGVIAVLGLAKFVSDRYIR